MKALSFGGMLVLLSLSLLLTDAGRVVAINLPAATVKGLSHQARPTGVSSLVKGPAVQGCPKLVARELHIVRVVPQRASTGEQAFRYLLNGSIQNRGLAGVAVVGVNVTQKTQRGAVKRVALKLFRQRVQPNQRLDLLGDLHVQVQSEPILASANPLPSFSLNVLNMQNDHSQCGERAGTTVSISANIVRRALLTQLKGDVSLSVDSVQGFSRKIKDKAERTNSGKDHKMEHLQQDVAARSEAVKMGADTIRETNKSNDEVIRNLR
ncbi:hypothetical protein [Geopsychrobacter electrodiphilus]|uniref:hypothetical protein n=1 Tax=Geopsychrobacter electrodiphilus TaxID=225196 RepID=UPI000382BB41|nr:hypothetical protein [Geopsychrobacter electrodiphilus]